MHRKPLIAHPLRAIIFLCMIVSFIFVLQSFNSQTPEDTNPPEQIVAEDLCGSMTFEEAVLIAETSEECSAGGNLQLSNPEMNYCNNRTHTWQFVLTDVTEPLCGAACYVHTDTQEATLEWMCTGLIVDEETE